jgi:hypothetical protein
MTALHIDYPPELALIIEPIRGVKMGDIMEVITKQAAYIEAGINFDNDRLEFYFCNKDGAPITVNDGNDKVCGYLSGKDSEPGAYGHAIYYAMRAFSLVGVVEEMEDAKVFSILGTGLARVLASYFPSRRDI